jgi:ribose transport system substrate-binding protein
VNIARRFFLGDQQANPTRHRIHGSSQQRLLVLNNVLCRVRNLVKYLKLECESALRNRKEGKHDAKSGCLPGRSRGVIAAALMLIAGAARAETDVDVVAAVEQATAEASVPPNAWHGPTTSPPAAQGKKITIISCLQASDCSIDAVRTAGAARAIGWEPTVVDGKGDVAVYNASIRTAVNNGADGIINIALPVPLIHDGLRYAREKNVPVVSSANVITHDPLLYADNEHQWTRQGNMLADWMIAESDGKAGVAVLRDDEYPGIKQREDGVVHELAKCTTCKLLADPNLSVMALINPTQISQQVQSLNARFGKGPHLHRDSVRQRRRLGRRGAQSIHRGDVKVVGYDGNKQQILLCEQGSVGAIAVTMQTWVGWGAVDLLNRAFNRDKPVRENVPTYLMTGAGCKGDGRAEQTVAFDFRSVYLKLWGGSKVSWPECRPRSMRSTTHCC